MSIPGPKAIALMVVRGFGLFLTVTGMVGLALILGPLNHVLKDLTFTPIADSKAVAAILCFVFTVIGGILDFVANAGLKAMDEQKFEKKLLVKLGKAESEPGLLMKIISNRLVIKIMGMSITAKVTTQLTPIFMSIISLSQAVTGLFKGKKREEPKAS